MKTSYLITYDVTIKTKLGTMQISNKEIKVHNRDSELLAKVGLEDYLKRKHGSQFVSLVIKSCNPIVKNPIEELLTGFNMN